MKVLNDVLGYNLKIYQNNEWFCFSIDSVILANFVNIRANTRKILDLGSGNGIVPLILSLRTKSFIEAVEVQRDLVELAEESIKYNKLENQIKFYNMDMKILLNKKDQYNSYDLILCNPPYFRKNERSTKNIDIHKVIARHEINITLEDIVNISSKLLKDGGVFATVNRCDRLIDVITLFKKYKIEPKYIRMVYDNITCKPSVFYLEGIKNGKSGLIVDKPFIMYKDNIKTEEYSNLIKEVM